MLTIILIGSFHKTNCYSNERKIAYYNKLDKLIFNESLEPNMVLVALDTSIKNNIVIFIAHIYSFNSPLKKILYYVINITSRDRIIYPQMCN